MKTTVAIAAACLWASTSFADPLNCNLSGYKPMGGLTATVAADVLTLTWDSERGEQVRARFAIDSGTPTIRELAVRSKAGQWNVLGTNRIPEYRIVSGLRRMTNQQITPLRSLKVPLTSGDRRSFQVGRVLGCAARHVGARASWRRRVRRWCRRRCSRGCRRGWRRWRQSAARPGGRISLGFPANLKKFAGRMRHSTPPAAR